MPDDLMDHYISGPLVDTGVRTQAGLADPSAEIRVVRHFRRLGRVEDETAALRNALAVEDIVFRRHKRSVDGIADRIIGTAVPAVGEIPGAAHLKEGRALAHVMRHRSEDRSEELPVFEIR